MTRTEPPVRTGRETGPAPMWCGARCRAVRDYRLPNTWIGRKKEMDMSRMPPMNTNA
jgi:hypothetical protein